MEQLVVLRDFSLYAKMYRKGRRLDRSTFSESVVDGLIQSGKVEEVVTVLPKVEHNLPIPSIANPDMGLKMSEPEEIAESRVEDGENDLSDNDLSSESSDK